MSDARKVPSNVHVVRRQAKRELKTIRPLESLDAAFEAIAQMTMR